MKASYDVKKSYVNNSYICYFKVDGKPYFGETGTKGTWYNTYPTKEKANEQIKPNITIKILFKLLLFILPLFKAIQFKICT